MKAPLSPRRRRVLRAFLHAMRPHGAALDAELDTDALLVSFEDFLRHIDPTVQRALPLLLEVLEYGTFALAGRSRPFSKLSPREQDAYLRGWQESALPLRRDIFKAVNAFFCLVYYSRPEVLRAIDYDHQRYAEGLRQRRYERFGAEIASHEERVQRGEARPLVRLREGGAR